VGGVTVDQSSNAVSEKMKRWKKPISSFL